MLLSSVNELWTIGESAVRIALISIFELLLPNIPEALYIAQTFLRGIIFPAGVLPYVPHCIICA